MIVNLINCMIKLQSITYTIPTINKCVWMTQKLHVIVYVDGIFLMTNRYEYTENEKITLRYKNTFLVYSTVFHYKFALLRNSWTRKHFLLTLVFEI